MDYNILAVGFIGAISGSIVSLVTLYALYRYESRQKAKAANELVNMIKGAYLASRSSKDNIAQFPDGNKFN